MAETFTSSKGVTLTIRPVSQFKIDSLRASKKDIPVPTYEMSTVAGEKQVVPLDEEIATNQGRLEEWKAYKSLHQEAEAAYGKRFFALLVWDGTDFEMAPEWEAEAAFFCIDIPENPIAKKVKYVYDQILGTPEDMSELMAVILLKSQLSQEVVDNLRNSFRSRMGRKANNRMSAQKVPVESERSGVLDAGDGALLEHTTE